MERYVVCTWYDVQVEHKNSCMFKFPTSLLPTNSRLAKHSPSAGCELPSPNLAGTFFALPCTLFNIVFFQKSFSMPHHLAYSVGSALTHQTTRPRPQLWETLGVENVTRYCLQAMRRIHHYQLSMSPRNQSITGYGPKQRQLLVWYMRSTGRKIKSKFIIA